MSNETQKKGGLSPGLLAAMAAPLAQTASGESWLTVLAVAGIFLVGGWFILRASEGEECNGKAWGALRWIWITIILSQTSHWVMDCWKDYKSYEAIPLSLLALGAWAAGKGEAVVKRASGVIFWGLLILLATIGVSAVKDVEAANLRPVWTVPDGAFLTTLLLPCIMYNEKGKDNNREDQLTLWGYTIVVSVLTIGVLSLKVARDVSSPIYELGRSISILGFAERFESLVAAAMTLGYFVLTANLLERAGGAAQSVKTGWHKPGILFSAAAAGGMLTWGIRIDGIVLALGIVLLWMCWPAGSRITGKIKMKKSKKSA